MVWPLFSTDNSAFVTVEGPSRVEIGDSVLYHSSFGLASISLGPNVRVEASRRVDGLAGHTSPNAIRSMSESPTIRPRTISCQDGIPVAPKTSTQALVKTAGACKPDLRL
jgi:hypothetical protein